MKIITLRETLKRVPEKYKEAYEFSKYWIERESNYSELLKLDLENCLLDDGIRDVKKIINDSWISTSCDECEESIIGDIVHLGDEPDYDSSTVFMCFPCFENAVAVFNEHKSQSRRI